MNDSNESKIDNKTICHSQDIECWRYLQEIRVPCKMYFWIFPIIKYSHDDSSRFDPKHYPCKLQPITRCKSTFRYLLVHFWKPQNLFFATCKNHATILFQKLNETELKIRRDFIDLNRKRRRGGKEHKLVYRQIFNKWF